MTLEGVDFSYARPGGAVLAGAGKHFVVRYITGWMSKALDAAEIRDYRAHGLDIALVFESFAGRARSGFGGGANDAANAVTAMRNLGIPAHLPVYFAVDWDATTAEYAVIDDYLAGVASVIGLDRTGIYGHSRLMAHCRAVKSAAWFWQTYAWSAGALFSGAHLFQYHNGQTVGGKGPVDLCRALRDDFGQWRSSVPPDTSTEATMPTAIDGGARVLASDYVRAVKATTPLFRDTDGTPLTTLSHDDTLDDFGPPVGTTGWTTVGIRSARFDGDPELESGLALVKTTDAGVGPLRAKTDAEKQATAARFYAAPAAPPDNTPFGQGDLDAQYAKGLAQGQTEGTAGEKVRLRNVLGI